MKDLIKHTFSRRKLSVSQGKKTYLCLVYPFKVIYIDQKSFDCPS